MEARNCIDLYLTLLQRKTQYIGNYFSLYMYY